MYIQSRVYKFNSSEKEVREKIARLSHHPHLEAEWLNEHTFCVQRKTFTLFRLEGDVRQIDSNKKLTIAVTAGSLYLLFYVIPVAMIVNGFFQWTKNS
ncbi:MAG: hypothetical protein ABI688_04565, partial [Bacteroidota bacterium]